MAFQRKKENIRLVVICYSLFLALMLYQTSYKNLGTITAFSTILLTIIVLLFSSKIKIKINLANITLFLFLLYLILETAIMPQLLSTSYKLIAQIIFFLVLSSITLNKQEEKYIKTIFILASIIYGILTIYACNLNYLAGYLHNDISLFNTKLDPNFIGIPLTASMSLVFYSFLYEKKRLISAAIYLLLAISIIYTASRGSFSTAIFSSALILLIYICNRDVSISKKVLIVLIVLVLGMFLIYFFSSTFSDHWDRMSDFTDTTGNSRISLWKRSLKAWRTHPILGVGLNGIYRLYGTATHNTYLEVLCETGIIGFILFISFIFKIVQKCYFVDISIFCMFMGILLQIAFLDALDNRCFWVVLCWIAMLPDNKGELNYAQETNT